jgi:hypothetical protein
MSRLISQILLAILLFPLAGLLYFIAVVFYWEVVASPTGWSRSRFNHGFVFAGVIAWAFVAVYWTLLWRKSVNWTSNRTSATMFCALVAGVAAVIIGGLVYLVEDEVGYFVGTAAAPLLWQVGTILVWRESPAERAERLAGAAGAVVCPTCGYNLTGLKGTRCPECGNQFTLDQLLSSQPAKAQVELEA